MSSPLGIGAERFHTGGHAGPGRDRVPRCVPSRRRRGGRWLRRGVHPGPGLGAELPAAGRGRGGLVRPDARRRLPAARERARARRQFHATGRWRRQVVRCHPRDREPALPRPARDGGRVRRRDARGSGRAASGRAGCWPVPCCRSGTWAWSPPGPWWSVAGCPLRARALLPVVLATMHLTWGAGFLRGCSVRGPGRETPLSCTGARRTDAARRADVDDRGPAMTTTATAPDWDAELQIYEPHRAGLPAVQAVLPRPRSSGCRSRPSTPGPASRPRTARPCSASCGSC